MNKINNIDNCEIRSTEDGDLVVYNVETQQIVRVANSDDLNKFDRSNEDEVVSD